jgi:hypothetical protein
MGYGIWDMGYGIWDMGYGIWYSVLSVVCTTHVLLSCFYGVLAQPIRAFAMVELCLIGAIRISHIEYFRRSTRPNTSSRLDKTSSSERC